MAARAGSTPSSARPAFMYAIARCSDSDAAIRPRGRSAAHPATPMTIAATNHLSLERALGAGTACRLPLEVASSAAHAYGIQSSVTSFTLTRLCAAYAANGIRAKEDQ